MDAEGNKIPAPHREDQLENDLTTLDIADCRQISVDVGRCGTCCLLSYNHVSGVCASRAEVADLKFDF